MKKLLSMSILFVLFGCHAAVYREISNKSISQRTDVFREVSKESDVPVGSIGLLVKAEIKTHHKDFYVLESRKSLHGKPQYPILINIDGQEVTWEMPGVRDDTPRYDNQGQITPEGGQGMKYTIEKTIALQPGRHNLADAKRRLMIIRECVLPVFDNNHIIVVRHVSDASDTC